MRWSQTLPHTLLNQLREQLVAATVSASVSQQKFYEVATDKGRKLKLEADLYKVANYYLDAVHTVHFFYSLCLINLNTNS